MPVRGWVALAAAGALACGGEARRSQREAGPLRWFAQVDGPRQSVYAFQTAFGVGVDAAGTRYLLGAEVQLVPYDREFTLDLRRFDPAGSPLGGRSWTYEGAASAYDGPTVFGLAVAPSGDALVGVWPSCFGPTCGRRIDLGAGPIAGYALARLDREGRLVWQKDLPGEPYSLDVAPDGSAVVAVFEPASSTLERIDAGGNVVWSVAASPERCASDEEGNAVCAWHEWPLDGASTLHVEKRAAADGAVLWTRAVPGPAYVTAVAARRGTVAVLARASPPGTLTFGASVVAATEDVLLVLDAAGAPRWAAADDLRLSRMTVDSAGRVVVGGNPGSCRTSVALHAYAPDGAPAWTWTLPSGGTCPAQGLASAYLGGLVADPGPDLTIGVYFTGALLLDEAILRSDTASALVVVLAP